MEAGFHEPFIELSEVPGKTGAAEFWHSGAICVNVGIMLAVTSISIVVVAAH